MDKPERIRTFIDLLRKFALVIIVVFVFGGVIFYVFRPRRPTQETLVLEPNKAQSIVVMTPILIEKQLPKIDREAEVIGDLLAQADIELRNRNRDTALQTLAKAKVVATKSRAVRINNANVDKKTSLLAKIEQIEREIHHDRIKEASIELRVVLDQIDTEND